MTDTPNDTVVNVPPKKSYPATVVVTNRTKGKPVIETDTTTEYIEGKIKAFDSEFDLDYPVKSTIVNEKVKAFIRSFAHDLVAETRKECLREVGEMIGKMKQLPYYAQPAQNRNGINYCSTCEQAWEDCSCSARNTGYKKALSDVLADLQEKMKGAI